MKKSLFLTAALFLASWTFADVQLRIQPDYYLPSDDSLSSAFEGTVALDFAPFTVRGRDSIYLSLQGNYGIVQADGIENMNFQGGAAALGYDCRFSDRFSLALEGFYGIWSVPESKENGFSSASGLSYGGRLFANFYAMPELSIGAFGGYKILDGFINTAEIGLCLKYNFSKGILGSSALSALDYEVDPVVPVFYSHYNDHPFGKIVLVNGEKNRITDVEVKFFVEKFMATPHLAAEFDSVGMYESFTADLTAFLNESILNQLLASNSEARVIVSYKSLGKSMEFVQDLSLVTLGRNNMSWDEDERAAAFVSGKDASANKFANLVRIVLKEKIDSSRNLGEQYARGMYAALKAYGINYVIDPASSFKDNVGTAAVDFLQFPYQTILYHGGDCDDLTILNCSLLEALGIPTAMITVPGHIYMAFDSGYSVAEASKVADGNYIIQNGKVWIPVEITLCQSTYANAKATGMREWKQAGKNAKLIPIADAYQKYKPISIPDSDINFELPAKEKILANY
ncbi:MAG: hypothetical protein KBT11_06770 [Treponema sp.]|nr:hypothetical protein [Candidatus Treponema equifaecale]